jgi:hypothetical protein
LPITAVPFPAIAPKGQNKVQPIKRVCSYNGPPIKKRIVTRKASKELRIRASGLYPVVLHNILYYTYIKMRDIKQNVVKEKLQKNYSNFKEEKTAKQE